MKKSLKGGCKFQPTPLFFGIKPKGDIQSLNCSDLQGIFPIIQSIPSKKAETFKLWLTHVGQECIEGIQYPERAILCVLKNI
jgi:hypothetical protein